MSTPEGRIYRTGEVFVAGGMPTVTYYPREGLRLEERIRDYLDERHKILSLSGPTKTGKTVLLRNLLAEPLWLSGGNIDSLDTFWLEVADKLAVNTEFSASDEQSESEERHREAGGAFFVQGSAGSSDQVGRARADTRGRSRPVASAARDALASGLHPLVVDDFHYIDAEVQLGIVRSLRELVFDGVPVIFASVPHRAYDVVRVEKEMTGRVEQVQIPFWDVEELLSIPATGFPVLNVTDPSGAIARRLADESFRSPLLMQEFCREVCKESGVRQTMWEETPLTAPDWPPFFQRRASGGSKSAFDLLARGPRARTDRKQRKLQGGQTVDIYGAVLTAIAETGPLTEITYEQLRAALRAVLASELPQRHEVTRVLEEMTRIAREQIEGEPVLDYDPDLDTLHISDPYFAYYLRWGAGAGTDDPPASGVMGGQERLDRDGLAVGRELDPGPETAPQRSSGELSAPHGHRTATR